MALGICFEDFKDYSFDQERVTNPAFRTLLQNHGLIDNQDEIAFLSCGGTISSAYSPARENIRPTKNNPIVDVSNDLCRAFGVAHRNSANMTVFFKDSRDITKEDVEFLLDVVNSLSNKRIIVSCGTYALPLITRIIGAHAIGEGKVIATTGSMLISSMRDHDVDFNAGGAISTVNALTKFSKTHQSPIVFLSFHGQIYTAEECLTLDLHPESHRDVQFYRGVTLHGGQPS